MRFLWLLLLLYSCKNETAPRPQARIAARAELFRHLPNDSAEIIFAGSTLTEDFPLFDFFHNPIIKNRGISGSTTIDLLNRTDEICDSKPTQVFMEAGNQDFLDSLDARAILHDMVHLGDRIKRLSPQTKLYVQSLLPTNGNYSKYNAGIKDVNMRLRWYCRDRQVTFINLYKLFLKDGELNPLYTYDGAHLNYAGYQVWAQAVQPFL
ncbi:MAG TPA: GDSL-type esterase/lipase family protein [Chitinophagaceae bacterium]|nr:GDSL-type esterase/lipase family protein [Chitinophagaceae bacterium]